MIHTYTYTHKYAHTFFLSVLQYIKVKVQLQTSFPFMFFGVDYIHLFLWGTLICWASAMWYCSFSYVLSDKQKKFSLPLWNPQNTPLQKKKKKKKQQSPLLETLRVQGPENSTFLWGKTKPISGLTKPALGCMWKEGKGWGLLWGYWGSPDIFHFVISLYHCSTSTTRWHSIWI